MVWGLIILFTVGIPALIVWGGKAVVDKFYGPQREVSGDKRGKWEYSPTHQQMIFVYDQRTAAQKAAEQGKRELGGCLIFVVLPLIVYAFAMIGWIASRG